MTLRLALANLLNMKRKAKQIQIKRATQAEILRDARQPYSRVTRKHRSAKRYKRNPRVEDSEK